MKVEDKHLAELQTEASEFIGDLEKGKLFTYLDTVVKLSRLGKIYPDCPLLPLYPWPNMFQGAGFFSIITWEMVNALEGEMRKRKLVGLPTIEVCAGRAALSYHLGRRGIPITPIDDMSADCTANTQPLTPVDRGLTHKQALEKYQPKVVIGGWIPDDPEIGADILNFPTVDYFIDIGETPPQSTWLTEDYRNDNFNMTLLPNVDRAAIWKMDHHTTSPGGVIYFFKYSEARLWQRKTLASGK